MQIASPSPDEYMKINTKSKSNNNSNTISNVITKSNSESKSIIESISSGISSTSSGSTSGSSSSIDDYKHDIKTRFMAYAHRNCVPHREHIYNQLVDFVTEYKLGIIHALGHCHGNKTNTIHHIGNRNSRRNNFNTLLPYKYILAMENKQKLFYLTEKIIYSLQARSIPIYYGDSKLIKEIFNDNIYIEITDLSNLTLVTNRILEIESNSTIYESILNTPIFRNGVDTVLTYFLNNNITDNPKHMRNKVRRAVHDSLVPISPISPL